MKIYIGSDHNGYALKQGLSDYIRALGYEVVDEGGDNKHPEDDFPQFASRVVMAIKSSDDPDPRGILICGSGQGMCMAANRYKGIRAIICDTVVEAKMGRNDDDSNVLCLPARLMESDQAQDVVKAWLETSFAGAARFKRRISELDQLG